MRTLNVAAAVAAALAASVAQASTILPNTGNGQLILFVKNNSTNEVYARGLVNPNGGAAITMDSVLTQSTLQGIPYNPIPQDPTVTFNTSLPNTIGPDSNLTTFLNAGSATGFSWTIMGGDGLGQVSGAGGTLGAQRLLTTSHTDFSQVDSIINPRITDSLLKLNTLQNQANSFIGGAVGDGSSTLTGGQWGDPTAVPGADAPMWFTMNQDNANTVGETTTSQLYVWATNTSGNFASSNVYKANLTVRMWADGTLSTNELIQPPATTPIPAAVWLLGSGLLGLAGLGRRRRLTYDDGLSMLSGCTLTAR